MKPSFWPEGGFPLVQNMYVLHDSIVLMIPVLFLLFFL